MFGRFWNGDFGLKFLRSSQKLLYNLLLRKIIKFLWRNNPKLIIKNTFLIISNPFRIIQHIKFIIYAHDTQVHKIHLTILIQDLLRNLVDFFAYKEFVAWYKVVYHSNMSPYYAIICNNVRRTPVYDLLNHTSLFSPSAAGLLAACYSLAR